MQRRSSIHFLQAKPAANYRTLGGGRLGLRVKIGPDHVHRVFREEQSGSQVILGRIRPRHSGRIKPPGFATVDDLRISPKETLNPLVVASVGGDSQGQGWIIVAAPKP